MHAIQARWARHPVALAAATLVAGGAVAAGGTLPTGMQVVAGQATAVTNGAKLTVTNSNNAVLNWQSFSVGANNTVRFDQPNAQSRVLNRVVGGDPSAIFGQISSNGSVWLLNPYGVLFGASARINVAGLVASTLNLSNADFASARNVFDGSGHGAVVNRGEIRTVAGGRVMLVGGADGVRNEGVIDTSGGQVVLAAGRSVELVDTALPNVAVRVSAPEGSAVNLGSIVAAAGRVDLLAAAVNQQGIVRADTVVLSGSDGVTLGAGSRTAADGAGGGRVAIDAGRGTLWAAGAVSATGSDGRGGAITLLGDQIGILGGARIDASGAAGGGDIRVGGGVQGRDPSIRNAGAVWFDRDAGIAADATRRGDGGTVVLWSDRATRAYGSLSAHGGDAGGNGGFVETSGHWLDARPASVRTGAAAGRAGQWLLDPTDVIITDNVSNTGISGNPNFTGNGGVAVLSTTTIVDALNQGNNVSVTTGTGGQNPGDIKVQQAHIQVAPGEAVTLTLNANRNVVFDFATIESRAAPLTLNVNAGTGGSGAVAVRSSTVTTAGGDILVGGSSTVCGPNICPPATNGTLATDATGLRDGIQVSASTLDAGSGSILLTGRSIAQGGDASGVAVIDGSTLNARFIQLVGSVDSNGGYFRTGVKLAGGLISADEGISVQGAATSAVYSNDAYPTGVDVLTELRVDGGNGESSGINITGTVNDGPRSTIPGLPVVRRFGVGIRGASARLAVSGGAELNVTGSDLSSNGDYGVLAVGSAPAYIDAGEASALRIQAGRGATLLSGDVRVPEGGTALFSARDTLTIENASINGNASAVTLNANAVEVGVGGASTQLVFGDDTGVAINASTFRLGAPGGEGGGGNQGELAAGRKHALDVSPPEATALIATGGPIRIRASDVFFEGSAALHSESAAAVAIGIEGPEGGGVTNFINRAGGEVLSTPNGRWLVLATDPDSEGFFAGGLRPDFRQYGQDDLLSPASGGNGLLFSETPQLSLSGPFGKVYDGTTVANLNEAEVAVFGLRGGDRLVGDPLFTDKNVGNGKPIVLAPGGPTGVVDVNGAPVYGYAVDTSSFRGDITPRTVTVASFFAQSKTYDGTTAVGVSYSLANVVPGDSLLVGSQTASFADPNVGNGKTVTSNVSGLAGGDAGNYVLGSPTTLTTTADIAPALLRYVADTVNIAQNAPIPSPLTGNVVGFVNGETQSTATTGTLAFTTPAENSATAGFFAINGSGLSAGNYTLAQASSNNGALRIAAPPAPEPPPAPPPPAPQQVNSAVTTAVISAVTLVTLAPETTSPQQGRSLDALQAVQPGATGERATFASLDLAKMSQDSVASVLAAREQYKKTVFSQAINRLEENPKLADAPGCASAAQAASGQCLLIDPVPGLQPFSNARVVEQAPVTAPAPGGVTQPAPRPPAAAPTPAPTTPSAADVALSSLPEQTLRLPTRRPVRAASVPQIERKIAVLIGVNEYSDERIPKLANAVGDARAVAQSLETNLGYETVVLENPSRTTIFRTLNQLSLALGPSDSVVVYYAGHGEVVDKTGIGYWQAADADATRPETWISNVDISRMLRALPASQVAMISDSCFSGSLVGDERIRGVTAADPSSLLNRRATVVMSSGGNEPVFDSGQGGHSPFANSLMQSLAKVSTWKPGSSLFEQVRFDVARQLPQRPQYGASRAGGHETGTDYLFEQRQLEGVTR